MVKKTVRKEKTAAKTPRKRTIPKKEITLEEIESSVEAEALSDFTDKTKKELKVLGDKIHEATDKGVHVVKDIASHVQRFAQDATELTRLKIELHNLKSERSKLYSLMGEQLRNLYISKKLTSIKKRFKDDFKKLDELETAIAEKEKSAKGISISEDIKKL
jgi:hypothetical protein